MTSTDLVKPAEWNGIVAQAEALSRSEIVPKAFRNKPDDIVAVAMIGREVGLSPMMSMQYVNVIDGKPSMGAEAMVALVRGKGHTIRCVHLDDDGCEVYGKRCDTGDEMSFTFTRQHAEDAGLFELTRNGKKTPWHNYFRSMAWARAVSQLCRMLFPDVIMGISYVPEELGAEVDGEGKVISNPAPSAVPPTMEAPTDVPTSGSDDSYRGPDGVLGNDYPHVPDYAGPVEEEAETVEILAEVHPAAAEDEEETEFRQPAPPPPLTPEQQHVRDADDLFKNGWPFGQKKGKPVTEMSTQDLQWFADTYKVKPGSYAELDEKRKAWCRRELELRTASANGSEELAQARADIMARIEKLPQEARDTLRDEMRSKRYVLKRLTDEQLDEVEAFIANLEADHAAA
jgi:hypothetical protein